MSLCWSRQLEQRKQRACTTLLSIFILTSFSRDFETDLHICKIDELETIFDFLYRQLEPTHYIASNCVFLSIGHFIVRNNVCSYIGHNEIKLNMFPAISRQYYLLYMFGVLRLVWYNYFP